MLFRSPRGQGASVVTPALTQGGSATATTAAFSGGTTSATLVNGYAYTIETGVVNVAKWIYKIWLGQFKGNYTDGVAYNEIAASDTIPKLMVQSPEFSTIGELITWATTDVAFGNHFLLDSTSAAIGAGGVVVGDISILTGYQMAIGGTETYSTSALDDVLSAIVDLDFQFLLVDKYGLTVTTTDAAYVAKLFAHVKDADTYFNKTLIVGGGKDEVEFSASTGSLDIAVYFNSNKAIVVHGSIKETTNQLSTGFRVWPSIVHAATILGRICGLQPQVPVTNKLIGVDGLSHNLKIKDQEKALDGGLLVTIQDYARGGFKVLQGVNTLQNNKVLFTNLGQSHSIQFERIVNQINRELVVGSETDLLNNESGVNVNTLSPGILKTWTETYLQSRVASPDADNLLLSFRNVTVTRVDDYYNVTYGIVVNNEITKIFYTGFLFKS